MATTRNAAQGILADDNTEDREKIIELLTKGYWMEIETVMSYIANSVNPDGVRAQEIIESLNADIMAEANAAKRLQIVDLLERAYWMEIETVMSYIANSVNPDGVRAQEIKESLAEDVQEELGHAQRFAQRIKELYGVVPGSLEFKSEQGYLQPPADQVDIVHVIRGVIEAETGAIEHYTRIVEETEGVDPVTQDMVIAILHDEQGHKRLFEGFLREYEAQGLA